MIWVLIFVTIAVGFGEYYCAHYFVQNIFRLNDNLAHLILGSLILLVLLLAKSFIWPAFMTALFFTPLVLWMSIRFSRSK